MSVQGELTRHLDQLVAALDRCAAPEAADIGGQLREARPRDPGTLSEAAGRILKTLADAGLTADHAGEAAPKAFSNETYEAAHTVEALGRIVLGR